MMVVHREVYLLNFSEEAFCTQGVQEGNQKFSLKSIKESETMAFFAEYA